MSFTVVVPEAHVAEVSDELKAYCELIPPKANSAPSARDLAFKDSPEWVEVAGIVKDAAPVVAAVLLYWLGKGRVIEVRVGDFQISTRGFSAEAVTKLLRAMQQHGGKK